MAESLEHYIQQFKKQTISTKNQYRSIDTEELLRSEASFDYQASKDTINSSDIISDISPSFTTENDFNSTISSQSSIENYIKRHSKKKLPMTKQIYPQNLKPLRKSPLKPVSEVEEDEHSENTNRLLKKLSYNLADFLPENSKGQSLNIQQLQVQTFLPEEKIQLTPSTNRSIEEQKYQPKTLPIQRKLFQQSIQSEDTEFLIQSSDDETPMNRLQQIEQPKKQLQLQLNQLQYQLFQQQKLQQNPSMQNQIQIKPQNLITQPARPKKLVICNQESINIPSSMSELTICSCIFQPEFQHFSNCQLLSVHLSQQPYESILCLEKKLKEQSQIKQESQLLNSEILQDFGALSSYQSNDLHLKDYMEKANQKEENQRVISTKQEEELNLEDQQSWKEINQQYEEQKIDYEQDIKENQDELIESQLNQFEEMQQKNDENIEQMLQNFKNSLENQAESFKMQLSQSYEVPKSLDYLIKREGVYDNLEEIEQNEVLNTEDLNSQENVKIKENEEKQEKAESVSSANTDYLLNMSDSDQQQLLFIQLLLSSLLYKTQLKWLNTNQQLQNLHN